MAAWCERCNEERATNKPCGECGACEYGYACWEASKCQRCIDNYEPTDADLQEAADAAFPTLSERQAEARKLKE